MPDKTAGRRRKQRHAKDRVLQARIPEHLDDELRGRAEQLGLSVSTIVRNVLLHTFDLVEGVVSDSSQIARALSGRGDSPPAQHAALPPTSVASTDATAAIVGWQEVILNKNAVCEDCNAILSVGTKAALGVPTGPRAILLCSGCLGLRASPATVRSESPASRKKQKAPAAKSTTRRKKTTS